MNILYDQYGNEIPGWLKTVTQSHKKDLRYSKRKSLLMMEEEEFSNNHHQNQNNNIDLSLSPTIKSCEKEVIKQASQIFGKSIRRQQINNSSYHHNNDHLSIDEMGRKKTITTTPQRR